MTVMEKQLQRADLKKYDSQVADDLLHLVNNLGVKYRVQDGGHLFLYAPNGEDRPFKASASRPGAIQHKYLVRFLNEECAEQQKEWEEKQAERAVNGKAAPTSRPTPAPAPTETVVADDGVALRPLAKGRTAYIKKGPGGGVIKYLETDGTTIWCRACEGWSGEKVVGGTSHYRMAHGGGGSLAQSGWDEFSRGKRAAMKAEREAERHAAIAVLAKAVGYEVGDSKKIERLEARLAKVTAERDEAIAKVRALKEALK